MTEKKIVILCEGPEYLDACARVKALFSNDFFDLTFAHISPEEYIKGQRPHSDLTVVFTDAQTLPSTITVGYSSVCALYDAAPLTGIISDPYGTTLFDETTSVYGDRGREIADRIVYSELGVEQVLRAAAEYAESCAAPLYVMSSEGIFSADRLLRLIASTIEHEYDFPFNMISPSAKTYSGMVCALKNTAWHLDKMVYSPALKRACWYLYANDKGDYLLHIGSKKPIPHSVFAFLRGIVFDL